MNRIPTMCVLGDFTDETRDEYFINQYKKDNVIQVFKYSNVSKESANLIDSIKNFINNK
jgi:hypothetical protein